MPLRDRLHRRGEMPVPVRRRIGGRRVAGYQDHRQGRPLQREGQQVGRVGQGVGAVGEDCLLYTSHQHNAQHLSGHAGGEGARGEPAEPDEIRRLDVQAGEAVKHRHHPAALSHHRHGVIQGLSLIHILESGQEFTCSDVDCRRKTVEDLCDLVLRYDIVLEELPYILEDFLLDQYDIAV